ncbi:MAG: aspartate/glutamate racemase family protein [Gammaproteobacteria bacterium]
MKTIGLLGGMSWESTALYYRIINEETRRRLGGLHSAPIAMVSVDFDEIEKIQQAANWAAAAAILAEAARRLELAGADFVLICTNTMHRVADDVAASIDIPLLHIADTTAEPLAASGKNTVGLLGTKFTMEQDFYRSRLEEHGLRVLTPPGKDREIVHRVIYEELCLGKLVPDSRVEYLRIIHDLGRRGADAVIAGCTEIGMLVGQAHTDVPLVDTTELHARSAVAEALK